MYKGVGKEQRDKVQLMAAEKKARQEVEELKAQVRNAIFVVTVVCMYMCVVIIFNLFYSTAGQSSFLMFFITVWC